MPRCAGSSTCNCVLKNGQNTIAVGAGTSSSPYRVDAAPQGVLTVSDTSSVNLTLTGQHDTGYNLSADATMHLNQLLDVYNGAPIVGQVLAWDGALWRPAPPATSAPGLINVGNCLRGDGSSGAPLNLKTDPDGGLTCTGDGVALVAQYHANTYTERFQMFAANDEDLLGTHTTFKTMPDGMFTFTAPAWATYGVVDFQVQGVYATTGSWAGARGRSMVRRSGTADYSNSLFGDTDGYLMQSMRNSGVRGSTCGYRDVRILGNVVGGETISIYSQMRATNVAGGGTMSVATGDTIIFAKVTWSDKATR